MTRLDIVRLVVWISLVAPALLLSGATHAAEDEPASEEEQLLEEYDELEGAGAAASDPTSSTNFQDIRYRYFDLENGDHRNSFEAEGSYAFTPRFKLSHKLVGVETDVTGESEADISELSLKPIFLTPMEPFGIKARLALGVEWLKDLGESSEGTGSGTDQIAPLAGVGWLPTEQDFIITLVQYFHSYDEDSRVDDVRRTGPRLIYIRKLPAIKGWARADFKGLIDHEDDNDFTQTFELQLGTMITQSIGIYGELLVGDSVLDTDAYDMGGGLALRVVY